MPESRLGLPILVLMADSRSGSRPLLASLDVEVRCDDGDRQDDDQPGEFFHRKTLPDTTKRRRSNDRRRSVWRALQLVVDRLEDAADGRAEKDQDRDHDDRNEGEQQPVLHERLAALVVTGANHLDEVGDVLKKH